MDVCVCVSVCGGEFRVLHSTLQKYCGKRLKENKKRKMYMYNNPNSTVGLKIKNYFCTDNNSGPHAHCNSPP